MSSWSPGVTILQPAKNVKYLIAVRPRLEALVDAYNENVVALLLDVHRSAVARWLSGDRDVSPENAARIVDLHDLVSRVHRYYRPAIAARWIVGAEPLLGGARPLDVLATRGVAPVIEALQARVAGGYA